MVGKGVICEVALSPHSGQRMVVRGGRLYVVGPDRTLWTAGGMCGIERNTGNAYTGFLNRYWYSSYQFKIMILVITILPQSYQYYRYWYFLISWKNINLSILK